MRVKIAIAALAASLAAPAAAQDAYVVGITAALTGPPASTYAPAMSAACRRAGRCASPMTAKCWC